MPMSPGARKVVHYSGYLHPIMMIAAGAGCLVALLLWFNSGEPVETEGIVILSLIGLGGVALGAYFLWRHSRQDPSTAIQTVDELPPAEGVRQTRNLMWIVGIVLTLGSAFMAYQLAQVEFGSTRSATVWGPVALAYELFGFWPAVLLLPALGAFLILALARKLRAIKERQTGRI
jgi:hypothetical protein